MSTDKPAIRHRNRKINTCLECRRLKRKCNRVQPCTQCIKTEKTCIFPAPGTTSRKSPPHGGPKNVHQPPGAAAASTSALTAAATAAPSSTHPQSSPALSLDGHSDGSSRALRKPPDICLRIGKMSITERIGGLHRADIVDTFTDTLRRGPYPDNGDNTHWDDQLSAPVIAWFKPHEGVPLGRLLCGIDDSPPESAHTPLSFPTPPVDRLQLSETQQRLLYDQFVAAVYPVCSVASPNDVHMHYGADEHLNGALQACIFYAAAISMPLMETQRLLGYPKEQLVKRLKTTAEETLAEVGIFQSLDLKLFQAVLVYLTPQLTAEVARSHSTFLAAITRHFQLAGYHRDEEPETYERRQLKRHLWQHLLLLNLRSTEAVGPEASLIDDPNAQLPELEMNRDLSANESSTSSTIVSIVRYECHRIHRLIFQERQQIKKVKTTFAVIEQKVNQAARRVRIRYLDRLDDSIPIQKYARIVGNILLHKAENMVRHPQWKDAQLSTMGIKLRDRSIQSCLDIMENAVILETDPGLSRWAWYAATYQQYHSILFPLSQVYSEPRLPDTDRIMAMTNHVFGPSSASPVIRSAGILRAVRDNMTSFLAAINTSAASPSSSSIAIASTNTNSSVGPGAAAAAAAAFPRYHAMSSLPNLHAQQIGGGAAMTALFPHHQHTNPVHMGPGINGEGTPPPLGNAPVYVDGSMLDYALGMNMLDAASPLGLGADSTNTNNHRTNNHNNSGGDAGVQDDGLEELLLAAAAGGAGMGSEMGGFLDTSSTSAEGSEEWSQWPPSAAVQGYGSQQHQQSHQQRYL